MEKSVKKVNSYNVYNENDRRNGVVPVMYYAIADSEDRVRELAVESGIALDGLTIELERENVRTELGRPYSERIEEAF